jgi:hypothetical protein
MQEYFTQCNIAKAKLGQVAKAPEIKKLGTATGFNI